MPAAALAIPAIQAGTSLIGGWMGSRAANNAAQQQQQVAQQVAQQLRSTATESGNALDGATAAARAAIIDTSGAAANGVQDAGDLAQGNIASATQNAQSGMTTAVNTANGTLADLYRGATEMTDPYRTAGAGAVSTLASSLAPGGDMAGPFKFSEDDPSYQWRLEQGRKALERSSAARGAVSGGGVMKAMERYAQGAASTEYGAAFDRFQKERGSRFDMLSGLAGIGQKAVGQQLDASTNYGRGVSDNLMRGADFTGTIGVRGAESAGDIGLRTATTAGGLRTNAANLAGQLQVNSAGRAGDWNMQGVRGAGEALMGGANARAAGTVGSANAWSGALSGVSNAVTNAMAKNPKFNPGGKGN
jgi:type II secretory pathway pseudopilin PulG